ncbi:hypothetical protein [Streptococcus mitis]|uniref:hypothetical protein n=1 Tax=Streptococcus mitis TaxID=28037 RepID=UPI0021B58E2C|nr:hypothetical protein [Streptococcus mitis]
MNQCKNCQIEFDESHNFCSKCGSRLEKLVKYETLRSEYLCNSFHGGRIFEKYGETIHFKRFIFNDEHYYIKKGELWKEEIISGDRTFITKLDSSYENEQNSIRQLFLFVNKEGIIVYSLGLNYLYYFPHNSTTGINYCEKITKSELQNFSDIYISDNLIFYSVQNYENYEIKINKDSYFRRTLPISMIKNNSYIEMFDVLTGKKETILSSCYLGDIYIDPTIYCGSKSNSRICGNKDYLVFPVSIYDTNWENWQDYELGQDIYFYPKSRRVLFNLNTKEMQMLQTDELQREFLLFDASRNQIWYSTQNNIYQRYDIASDTTEEFTLKYGSELSYFDGIEAFKVDQYSIYRLNNDGSKSENLRTDSYFNLRDDSFFKTDKWLMVQGEGNPGVTEEYRYFENGSNTPSYKSVFDFESQL